MFVIIIVGVSSILIMAELICLLSQTTEMSVWTFIEYVFEQNNLINIGYTILHTSRWDKRIKV